MSFTNGYIEKTGCKVLKNFIGCFPADLQPITKKQQFSLVFNLSKHNEEGSHFVAIYKNKHQLIYFDSFGEPPQKKLIKQFLKKHEKNRKFLYNKIKIQDDTSYFCGIFCLSFLVSQENNMSLKNFLNNFDKINLTQNDKKCIYLLKFLINKQNT